MNGGAQDGPHHGRLIVVNTIPDGDGRVYFVLSAADPKGFSWFGRFPAELTYTDQEA